MGVHVLQGDLHLRSIHQYEILCWKVRQFASLGGLSRPFQNLNECQRRCLVVSEQLSGRTQLSQYLQLLRMCRSEVQVFIPDVLEACIDILPEGKIGKMPAELHPQLQIEVAQQFVLGFEIRKQRALGDARRLGDSRSRRAGYTAFRTNAQCRIENRSSFVTTPGACHPSRSDFYYLSAYSLIFYRS